MLGEVTGQAVFHLNTTGWVASTVEFEVGYVYRSPAARLHADAGLASSSKCGR